MDNTLFNFIDPIAKVWGNYQPVFTGPVRLRKAAGEKGCKTGRRRIGGVSINVKPLRNERAVKGTVFRGKAAA